MKKREVLQLYFILLIICAGISALVSFKTIALTILFGTFGLGLPILFTATAFVYLACMFPVVIYWNKPHFQILSFLFTVSLVTAAAILPSQLSEYQAKATTTAMIAKDIRPQAPLSGRSLEIVRKQAFDPDLTGTPIEKAPCGSECYTLLLGGEVDWIRVVMIDGGKIKNSLYYGTQNTSLFVAANGDKCQIPGQSARSNRRCVIFSEDHRKQADFQITFTEGMKIPLEISTVPLIRSIGWRLITIGQRQGNQYHEVLHHSELQFQLIYWPTVFYSNWEKGKSIRISWLGFWETKKKRYNPINFTSILRSLGFEMKEISGAGLKERKSSNWRETPTEDQTRLVMSILNLPGNGLFNSEKSQVIHDWLRHARQYKDWPLERIEFLRRIVRDPRMIFIFNLEIDQIFRKNEEVKKMLLPDVVQMRKRQEELKNK